MKIFSPTAILALGLALSTSSFEQAQAAPCTFPTGVTGTNVDVAKASAPNTPTLTEAKERVAANACPTGQISYLKSVVVLPQDGQVMTNVEVQLFKGDATTPIAGLTAETCEGIKYTNVGMSAASTDDISYKVVCKDTEAACKVTHGAEWGCYTPFFAKSLDKTVKRKTQVGTGCTSDSDACVSRCARSYKITTDSTGTTATMKTAYTPGDCTCTDLTATVQDDGISAKKDTSLTVSVDGTTITVTTATCTSTYEEGAVTNPFTAGTYTRGTVTPDTCVTADCTYKCGAELALTAPSNDAVVGTPATVSGCTCTRAFEDCYDPHGQVDCRKRHVHSSIHSQRCVRRQYQHNFSIPLSNEWCFGQHNLGCSRDGSHCCCWRVCDGLRKAPIPTPRTGRIFKVLHNFISHLLSLLVPQSDDLRNISSLEFIENTQDCRGDCILSGNDNGRTMVALISRVSGSRHSNCFICFPIHVERSRTEGGFELSICLQLQT